MVGDKPADNHHWNVLSSHGAKLSIVNVKRIIASELSILFIQALNEPGTFELVHERAVDQRFDAHLGDLGLSWVKSFAAASCLHAGVRRARNW
jgi:hypothetical protein